MDIDNLVLNIVDDQIAEEGLGQLVSFGVLSAVLSMAGIVEGATFNKNIEKLAKGSGQTTLTITKSDLKDVVEKSKNTDSETLIGKYTKAKVKNILTRTIWMESREDGEEGMRMTLSTIFNRAGKVVPGMVDECFQYLQYSCWNDVPSSQKTPSGYSIQFPKCVLFGKGGMDAQTWNIASNLVDQVLNGTFKPTNNKWTSYYNPDKCNPSWSSKLKNITKVGHHIVGQEEWRLNSANKKSQLANQVKDNKTWKVKDGDTLWGIAKKSGMQVDQLKKLNGLTGNTINPGQVLKLA